MAADPAIIVLCTLRERRERFWEVGAMLQALGKRHVEGVVAGIRDREAAWTLAEQEKKS